MNGLTGVVRPSANGLTSRKINETILRPFGTRLNCGNTEWSHRVSHGLTNGLRSHTPYRGWDRAETATETRTVQARAAIATRAWLNEHIADAAKDTT